MKAIVYSRPDGGVSIVNPAPEFVAAFDTEDEALAAVRAKDVPPEATDIAVVDSSTLSGDRTFRDAWTRPAGGGGIDTDMIKARDIHREHLRRLRAPKMAVLDVAYQRADEAGDAAEKTRVAAEKQVLRDATADPGIEAAATPADLKQVMPRALE